MSPKAIYNNKKNKCTASPLRPKKTALTAVDFQSEIGLKAIIIRVLRVNFSVNLARDILVVILLSDPISADCQNRSQTSLNALYSNSLNAPEYGIILRLVLFDLLTVRQLYDQVKTSRSEIFQSTCIPIPPFDPFLGDALLGLAGLPN